MAKRKEPILLHVCCSSCSPYVINVVAREFEPTIYYYNPNIHPEDEYVKRRLDLEGYVRSLGYDFVEGLYDKERWLYMTAGLEYEHEGRGRCDICFKMRLNRVALYAIQHGFEWFATTLTVSPYKNSRVINRIGRELASDYNLQFFDTDFKKKDGFKISMRMTKELDFYRQKYCGCVYSMRETEEKRRVMDDIRRQSEQIVSPVNSGY